MTALQQTKKWNENHNNLVEEEAFERAYRDIYYAAKHYDSNHCRILKDWGLYFKADVGHEKRLKIMRKFTSFYDKRKLETIEFDGDFMIGGEVWGLPGFTNGAYITVCGIRSIERVRLFGNNEKPKDLLKFFAQTPDQDESWDFYLFESDACTKLKLMLSDIHRTGKLRDKPCYYVPESILAFQKDLL